MIPPLVQPGDEFQRVRMPDRAGEANESLQVASVSGELAQLEWAEHVKRSDLLAALNEKAADLPQEDPQLPRKFWLEPPGLVPRYTGTSAVIDTSYIDSSWIE